jgi:hypothetical protein
MIRHYFIKLEKNNNNNIFILFYNSNFEMENKNSTYKVSQGILTPLVGSPGFLIIKLFSS